MQRDEFVSIFLVDDHAIYRAGIRAHLQEAGCFTPKIIGEAGSGAEFSAALKSGLIPELIILDIVLPDTTGVEIARHLKNNYPEIKIIMLSSEVSPELIHELLDIGVEGYLGKLAQIEDIKTAVCSVMGGVPYYGRSVIKIMYDVSITHQHKAVQQNNNHFRLFSKQHNSDSIFTTRENEVIALLCDGLQMKEVADKLNISPRTVESHKTNILKKMGFTRITELIKYAISEGLIS